MNFRHVASLAALNIFFGVACGAFGAHALQARLTPAMLAVWHIGVDYQQIHGLGLFAVAWLLAQNAVGVFRVAAGLMFIGILLFSGSLYALALTDIRWLGAITPLGGLAFLGAWLLVALGVWRTPSTH